MFNPFSLENKTFLITGASSGIGRDIAICISKMAGRVIITGRDTLKLEETFMMLDKNHQHFCEAFDLSEIEKIPNWISDITKKNDIKIDGFVHSAGINKIVPLHIIKNNDIQDIMSVNFNSGMILLRSCAKKQICNKGSSFVFISSVAGLSGEQGLLAYCASKAALNSAVKTSALELARFGFRVNSIAPGMIKTPMTDKQYEGILDEEQMATLMSKFPLGLGNAQDVSNAAIFLLSEASKWVTGTTLVVDGGYMCGK